MTEPAPKVPASDALESPRIDARPLPSHGHTLAHYPRPQAPCATPEDQDRTESEAYIRKALVRWCSMVDQSGGMEACWPWTGSLRGGGYGSFGFAGQVVQAHRWGYEILVGPVAADHELHHVCENPRCVNPRHLAPLTRHEHRAVSPRWNGNKTHCKRGHPLSGENVILTKAGSRKCLACERVYEASRRGKVRRKKSPPPKLPAGLHPTLAKAYGVWGPTEG